MGSIAALDRFAALEEHFEPVRELLSASTFEEDHAWLEAVLGSGLWTVSTASTFAAALAQLRFGRAAVAICDQELEWRELLETVLLLPAPPFVIVSSRLADEHLWAEALNLGAFDVLAKPFDILEVTRATDFAWRHWQERPPVLPMKTQLLRAAG